MRPEYHLNIIGKWDENEMAMYMDSYPHLHFLGFVENLSDELKGTVMIVPITIGSGIRMKILEAASLSVPFVTTSIGVEGLEFKNGESCLIGDTPEDFLNGILAMESRDVRNRMVNMAKQIVETKYSFDALRRNRLEILSKVINKAI